MNYVYGNIYLLQFLTLFAVWGSVQMEMTAQLKSFQGVVMVVVSEVVIRYVYNAYIDRYIFQCI